jgi:lipoprotein-anchoring transpeptidase ErfK/SrfK
MALSFRRDAQENTACLWLRRLLPVLVIFFGVLVQTNAGFAGVEARINLKTQEMIVKVDGAVAHVWKVSTARRGYVTPRGAYVPKRMHKRYYSKKYHNSPMPYSIFFKGGYAVHGTSAVKRLGAPASHGCIRLSTEHARALYNLVKAHGPGHSRIVIS